MKAPGNKQNQTSCLPGSLAWPAAGARSRGRDRRSGSRLPGETGSWAACKAQPQNVPLPPSPKAGVMVQAEWIPLHTQLLTQAPRCSQAPRTNPHKHVCAPCGQGAGGGKTEDTEGGAGGEEEATVAYRTTLPAEYGTLKCTLKLRGCCSEKVKRTLEQLVGHWTK